MQCLSHRALRNESLREWFNLPTCIYLRLPEAFSTSVTLLHDPPVEAAGGHEMAPEPAAGQRPGPAGPHKRSHPASPRLRHLRVWAAFAKNHDTKKRESCGSAKQLGSGGNAGPRSPEGPAEGAAARTPARSVPPAAGCGPGAVCRPPREGFLGPTPKPELPVASSIPQPAQPIPFPCLNVLSNAIRRPRQPPHCLQCSLRSYRPADVSLCPTSSVSASDIPCEKAVSSVAFLYSKMRCRRTTHCYSSQQVLDREFTCQTDPKDLSQTLNSLCLGH